MPQFLQLYFVKNICKIKQNKYGDYVTKMFGYSPRDKKRKTLEKYFGYLLGKVDLPFLSKGEDGLLGIDSYALTETKKPAPTDGDGLSETARQIMECVNRMSPKEQEAFLAWLQASQGRG